MTLFWLVGKLCEMTTLKKFKRLGFHFAGAALLNPILHQLAPWVVPLVNHIVPSDELQKLLAEITESGAGVGGVVIAESLYVRGRELLDNFKKTPTLEEAMVVAVADAFKNMGRDLRKKQPPNSIKSFEGFFQDWSDKLSEIAVDDYQRAELLGTKQFARLFYENVNTEGDRHASWQSVKSHLEAWTRYGSIASELEAYLKENLLVYTNDALMRRLVSQPYKQAWYEFQTSVDTQILSLLRRVETHILKLQELIRIAGGQFLAGGEVTEFFLRSRIDSLVRELSGNEIFIQREVFINEDERVQIFSLADMTSRNGYFLLASPAGSGKSTLMARWIQEQFISQTDCDNEFPILCYQFYSKQGGTSDLNEGLTILSEQLLRAHNIQANVQNSNPAATRSIIFNSLALAHPRRLIVIVDGLDEAGEPSAFKSIFPPNLGENTTVILTARNYEGKNSLQHYQTKLGVPLKELAIADLNVQAVGTFLSSVTDAAISSKAQDQTFLQQVITRTEGLAIYVHSLLDELSRTRERSWENVIADLPRGFEDYVRTSLGKALANEPSWQDALCFIALTESPLEEDDLIRLDGPGWPQTKQD